MNAPFTPPSPPRGLGPVPVWRGFFGKRARTAVYGWSAAAFEAPHIRRNVLGYRVHIPLDPDAVERVLLDNAANYVKPDLVKKLLSRTIGRGLLSSDGALWRDQRRIVAANFAPAAIDALVPVFARAADGAGLAAGVRDMSEHATATTMRIIADALFAGDPAAGDAGGDGPYRRGARGSQRGAAADPARPAADAVEPQGQARAARPGLPARDARRRGARPASRRRRRTISSAA